MLAVAGIGAKTPKVKASAGIIFIDLFGRHIFMAQT
jgi:hypothetical protein